MSDSQLKNKHIYLDSLGCSKNRVDSEIMLSVLMQKSCELVSDPKDAEIILVNTCAFLTSATEESIDRILELSDCKKSGVCEKLVVTGCLSQRYQDELFQEIPEIDGILGAHSFERIVELLENIYADSGWPQSILTQKPYYQHFAVQERVQSTPRHFAYVKIAEGCSNMCTFCNIPFLRGHFSSRTIESIVTEIQYMVEKGVQEINLISQDTSSYGKDLQDDTTLARLLKAISKVQGDFWIRMFYCYPNRLTEQVLEVMAEDSRFCRYLDMPFQHINNAVLKQMNRKITRQQIEEKMTMVESFLPDVAWRTTFIVGFPTETEAAFAELSEFVSTQCFHNLGVFSYSHENNAPASKRWDDLVSEELKEERKQHLMTLQQSISLQRNQERVGQTLKVLVDGISEESSLLLQGRSQYQGAEVDGLVYINDGEARPGSFHSVEITEANHYDLIGRIV